MSSLTWGSLSWDITLSKVLAIILQAACAARAGDVALTDHYESHESMSWKHLDLRIQDRPVATRPTVSDLTLTITLAFTKNNK